MSEDIYLAYTSRLQLAGIARAVYVTKPTRFVVVLGAAVQTAWYRLTKRCRDSDDFTKCQRLASHRDVHNETILGFLI